MWMNHEKMIRGKLGMKAIEVIEGLWYEQL